MFLDGEREALDEQRDWFQGLVKSAGGCCILRRFQVYPGGRLGRKGNREWAGKEEELEPRRRTMLAGRYQGRPADEGWAAKETERGSRFVYASRTHWGL